MQKFKLEVAMEIMAIQRLNRVSVVTLMKQNMSNKTFRANEFNSEGLTTSLAASVEGVKFHSRRNYDYFA